MANVCGLKMEQTTFKCWLFCWLPSLKIGGVWFLPSSLTQLLRRCHWCMRRHKGLMPPSCGLLQPCGWSVPAPIFQPDPRSLLGQGWWWLRVLGTAGGERGGAARPQPGSTALPRRGVSPNCFRRSAVALLLAFVKLNLSYLNYC